METGQERLEEILAEAIARTDPSARAAYLAEACAGDAALRSKVEELIAAYEKHGDLVERTLAAPGLAPEGPGSFIGRYKLLQEIGEGAFGVVYMAEQTEPVQRKVALKIIKAGMDTRAVIARFEAERQALALMDHPNIAKVLDAGTTETGRPYFVMELVKGLPITAYADQHNLSTEERLRLFMQVCHGVQHAHQKGIIHRDLKPTNILVTVIDGEPVPKIIDFGVAKALGQKLTDKTLFTAFEQIIGTPAYMSPEQAELSGVDIDTRSDIYSLGVLLYEFLTGVTPFDQEMLRQAALDKVRRIIQETEPPKPSTCLQALVAADVRRLKSSGDRRSTEEEIRASSRRLLRIKETIRLLHGDLDWIVMKALEKDRRRRYETASGLAEDIQRHRDHQPVHAGPPSTVYRARKFIRRHRMGVTLAASVTAALIAGLLVSLIGFRKAREERDHALAAEGEAQKQQARAEQLARQEAEQRQRRQDEIVTLRSELAGFVNQLQDGDAQTRNEFAWLLATCANPALRNGPQALVLAKKVVVLTRRTNADYLDTLAAAYAEAGQFTNAVNVQKEAIALLTTEEGKKASSSRLQLYESGIPYHEHGELARQARSLLDAGKFAEAEPLARECVGLRERLIPDNWLTFNARSLLGGSLLGQKEYAKAEPLLLSGYEGLKQREAQIPTAGKVRLQESLQRLVQLYEASGRPAEAARWKQKLADFEKTDKKPTEPPP